MRTQLIPKNGSAKAVRRVTLAHAPTPALARAIRDLQAGDYDEYNSVQAVRADIEAEKRKLRR